MEEDKGEVRDLQRQGKGVTKGQQAYVTQFLERAAMILGL